MRRQQRSKSRTAFAAAIVSILALCIDTGVGGGLVSSPSLAGPALSLPSLRSLKRRFIRKQRGGRSRKHQKPSAENPAASGGTAAGGAGISVVPSTPAPSDASQQNDTAALPPLPTPDPRRRRLARNPDKTPPKEQARLTPPLSEQNQEPAIVTEESEKDQATLHIEAEPLGLSDLPARNPRRLSKRIAVQLSGALPKSRLRPPARRSTLQPDTQPASLPPSQISGEEWTPTFIVKAENECTALLANVAMEGQSVPAFRQGLCGAPAARLLSGISSSPRVEFQPAATLSCKMVAGLAQWFRDDVQPLAKKNLGSEVKRIMNISSFVCRNRYGDNDARISEHAFANALDVAGFELADGRKVMVEDGWNDEASGRSAFLHALHNTACKRFGTVLGPDANAAHKNHLHLDMAPRRQTNYCR